VVILRTSRIVWLKRTLRQSAAFAGLSYFTASSGIVVSRLGRPASPPALPSGERVRAAPNTAALDETEAMARVYFVLGVMNYFAVSRPTLTQMLGKVALKALRDQLRLEIRRALQTA
jgi:hypothetical protein